MSWLRRLFVPCLVLLASSSGLSAASPSAPAPWIPPPPSSSPGIQIVSGSFGTLGAKSRLDIAAWVQNYCGPSAQSCKIFCSETSFGQWKLGRKPICRVMYRCGVDYVRSVEAMREEPILMKCPEPRPDPLLVPPPPLNN